MSDPIVGKLKEWKNHPLIFVSEALGVKHISDQQADGLVQFAKTKMMSIRSGHGTGKTVFAAWCILWFLTTRAFSKVMCTAPTGRQLSDYLWSTISKWLRQSLIADEFIIQKDKVYHISSPKEWWARAISASVKATKEEQAETLSGIHDKHLLIVVDESAGVHDPVFTPIEGALTQEDNKVLLIGNMTQNKGYFYDTHFHSTIKQAWTRLHWDCRKSSLVKPEYPEYMAAKYGVDSNIFRIRVEGNPPLDDDTVLIPTTWAQQCVGNEIPEESIKDDPLYLGVDVARYGDDASIILPRRNHKIYPWSEFKTMNTMDLGGYINQDYYELNAEGVGIDVIGVGGPVYDWLQKKNIPGLTGVNVTHSSSDITKYHRLRDELWCRVRDKCMLGLYSFPEIKRPMDQESLGVQLVNELCSVKYKFNAHGGIVVESKKDMKARGIASPNIADALCITEYFHNMSSRIWKKKKKKKTIRPGMEKETRLTRDTWQIA